MIRSLLGALGLAGRSADPAEINVSRVTYAVGDIHGRADLLDRLIAVIKEDRRTFAVESPCIVFLGDYIDRGPDSLEVLKRLQGLATEVEGNVLGLRGNHEIMLQEFLADPEAAAPRWFRNGGLETLLSCQVGGIVPSTSGDALLDARDRLAEALEPVSSWLAELRPLYQDGNVVLTHAGADPDLPISEQTERALAWGVPSFLDTPRADDLWIVHGHYTVDKPTFGERRISIDTGAYFSGRLTAARIAPGSVTFLES